MVKEPTRSREPKTQKGIKYHLDGVGTSNQFGFLILYRLFRSCISNRGMYGAVSELIPFVKLMG